MKWSVSEWPVTLFVALPSSHSENTFNQRNYVRRMLAFFLSFMNFDSHKYQKHRGARHSFIRTKEFYCLLPYYVPLKSSVRCVFIFLLSTFFVLILSICRTHTHTLAQWPRSSPFPLFSRLRALLDHFKDYNYEIKAEL